MNSVIQGIQEKICTWESILSQIEQWRANQEVIVFTNGCFDLLHYGHLTYLAEARSLGDRLVIGLNSQDSVSRLKGAHRPIKDEISRIHLLAGFSFVDAVVTFQEDTPYDLIQHILPNILVKGGDWQPHQIVGADLVLEQGGVVKSLPFIEGYSTTLLEQKIRSWS